MPTIRHMASALYVDDTSEASPVVRGYGANTGAQCCAKLLIYKMGQ